VISVRFELDDLEDDNALDITEDRGQLVFKVRRDLEPEQIMEVLTEGAAKVLAGGHWFQEWKGDIITVEPCETGRQVPPQRAVLHDVAEADEA